MEVINFIRKCLNILLIVVVLLFFLEIFQRARHFYVTKNRVWLFYGLAMPREVIKIKGERKLFFRPPYKIMKKNEGKNILFIGGSSTYGVYNDNFYTFPYLLEKKLQGVACLNAGRPSLSSDGYLDVLKACCDKFVIPDMVVFYTGYNDIFAKKFDFNQIKFPSWLAKMERFSFLLLTLRQKLIITRQIRLRNDDNYRKKFVMEFVKSLEECIEFAKNKDIKVVLIPEVLMAKRFSLGPTRDYRWYREVYLEIPAQVRALARKYNCYFLDPLQELYIDWENYFTDPVHLTDKGNELLSDFLLGNLPL